MAGDESDTRRFAGLARRTVLGVQVPVARGLRARTLGLALLPREQTGGGLLIPRCRAVHTFGMRFAIDVLFLDREGRLIRREDRVPTGRMLFCRDAAAVLELPSGGGENRRPSA